jgi:hypothetical protein
MRDRCGADLYDLRNAGFQPARASTTTITRAAVLQNARIPAVVQSAGYASPQSVGWNARAAMLTFAVCCSPFAVIFALCRLPFAFSERTALAPPRALSDGLWQRAFALCCSRFADCPEGGAQP